MEGEKKQHIDYVELENEFIRLYARMEMATDPVEKEKLSKKVAELSRIVAEHNLRKQEPPNL